MQRFRVNAPQVIAETIEGETIVVHLSTGCYFNLEGSAVEVWEGIADTLELPVIVDMLASRYDASREEIEASVERLIGGLQGEDLIVPLDEDGAASGNIESSVPEPPEQRAPFVEPTFHKFTDMQDIILLDPVHEVDARGWPHAEPRA